MAPKRYTSEQIIGKLRAIEVHLYSGLTAEQAARREEISVQSYFHWRKEYGGMRVGQAKRLKEMEIGEGERPAEEAGGPPTSVWNVSGGERG